MASLIGFLTESSFELYFRNFNPDDQRASIFFLIVLVFFTMFAPILENQRKSRAIQLIPRWICRTVI